MQVAAKDFFKAVEYVSKLVPISRDIPALKRVRIDAEPWRLIVSANCLHTLAAVEIPVNGVERWTALVDPSAVKSIKTLANGTLDITARKHEEHEFDNLVINTGDDEIELIGLKLEPFIDWWEMLDDNPVSYGTALMTKKEMPLIKHLLNHASKDDIRPKLEGVYLDLYGLTATDTARLLHVPHSIQPVLYVPGVVIAPECMEMLAANPYQSETVAIEIKGKEPDVDGTPRPKVAYITAGPVRIWSKLVHTTYVPYRHLFELDLPKPQFLIKPDQYEKIERVLATAKRLAKYGSVVRIGLDDGNMKMESLTADTGAIRSKLPVQTLNGAVSPHQTFYANYIIDMIKVYDTLNEPVEVTIADEPGKPSKFVGTGSGVVCLIMPMRKG